MFDSFLEKWKAFATFGVSVHKFSSDAAGKVSLFVIDWLNVLLFCAGNSSASSGGASLTSFTSYLVGSVSSIGFGSSDGR